MKRLYSAAGTLFTQTSQELELILAKRSKTSSFFPDYYVMPGGLISKEDVSLAEQSLQLLEKKEGGLPESAYRLAFLREFFEETGVWPFNTKDLPLDEALFLRKKLVRKEISFQDFLETINMHPSELPLEDMIYIGVRITPPFSPRVYVTRYYLVPVTEKYPVFKYEKEHSRVEWVRAREILKRYEKLEVKLPPPTLQQLRFLARMPFQEAVQELVAKDHSEFGVGLPIEILPNLEVIPIKTNTLPPLTTTNFVIMGGKEFYILDPGSNEEQEIQQQIAILNRLLSEQKKPRGIIVTHQHKDHWLGVRRLIEKFELPVYAHKLTIEKLKQDIPELQEIKNGDRIPVKNVHGDPYDLEVIWTPGHTEGSISVRDTWSNAIAVGDMVAGIGTVILIPGESDLEQYMDSLKRLVSYKPRILVPGHGPVILHPIQVLEYYITHRMERHFKIQEVLKKDNPRTLDELVAKVYTDVPQDLHYLAVQSLVVHLHALFKEGKIAKQYYDVLCSSFHEIPTCL